MAGQFFNATLPTSDLSIGTAGKLVAWLESYINVVFPNHSVDYWSAYDYGDNPKLLGPDALPISGSKERDIHHVVSYVRPGRNEGKIIEVGFYLRDNTLLSLSWLKAFGTSEECWNIARAISEVLDLIVFEQSIPEIADMAQKICTKNSKCREKAIRGDVTICATLNTLTVTTGQGNVLDNRRWDNEGSSSGYSVGLRVKDWEQVLTNLKVAYKVERHNQMMVDDLPDYIFSTRGLTNSKGLYVLLPGGDPLDDADYLGYFESADLAKAAARAHRDAKILEMA